MQVKSIAECSEGNILQYFRLSLSYHLSLRFLCRLFLSGHFAQGILIAFHSLYSNLDCGFVTAPTNGLVALPLIPAEDQEVSYSCNNGFALSDVSLATRTCLATGQWDKTAPLCIVGKFKTTVLKYQNQ